MCSREICSTRLSSHLILPFLGDVELLLAPIDNITIIDLC